MISIRYQGLQIESVFKDGLITGSYSNDDEEYSVFATIGPSLAGSPVGCSCGESNGQPQCQHSYAFVRLILAELAENGIVTRTIDQQAFATTVPSPDAFKHDPRLAALSGLKRLIRNNEAHNEQLERPTWDEQERVAWDVSLEFNAVSVAVMLQSKSPKGGWIKGRKVSPDMLNRGQSRSEADYRALELYGKRNQNSYSLAYSVAPKVEVLTALMGQPNVFCDGLPVTVVEGDGLLVLTERADGWVVRPAYGSRMVDRFGFAHDGMLSVDEELGCLMVFCSAGRHLQAMQHLCALPVLTGQKHIDFLMQQMNEIQTTVSLKLPEELAGPIVPRQLSPVMILRTQRGGRLDYGLRMRDLAGTVYKPGAGPIVQCGQQDGRNVQWMRSMREEIAIRDSWQKKLGLKILAHDGTLSFVDGLRLMEALESSADQIEIVWDKTSTDRLRSLGSVTPKNLRVTVARHRDWFQLDGECVLGGTRIKIGELMSSLSAEDAAESQCDYVRVGDDGWAKVSSELRATLKRLADVVHPDRSAMRFDHTSTLGIRELLPHLRIDQNAAWKDCLKRLERAEKLEPQLPDKLQAVLRDYQEAGFKWLRRLAEWGVGAVLADDMGLGKTVQTLAVVIDRAVLGPTLVIAPTSVGFNWMREIERFAPHLQAKLYRETDRELVLKDLKPDQLIVCSYGLALRDSAKLAQVQWMTLVLDEAQAIKNSRSKTSQAIASIAAHWKVALSGTPVENHLGELWSLFHIVSPGVLGSWEQFRSRYAIPIERDQDAGRRIALRERLKPFILRRTKSEVLRDLPPRTEITIEVELSLAERQLYDASRMAAVSEASEISALPDTNEQRFKLLALLTRLRQLACHPKMVQESWTEDSAKLLQLRDTLHQLREEGHRVLVFSQFVKHLTLIREMLDREKITYHYLDGSTPAHQRQQEVDNFQNGRSTAFLISLKAGGTGLNLTAADYVIHMDPWWNPAVEDQATDRAHRIGQSKPVMVYRLISQGTIEEEILKLHEEKRELVAGILEGTHSAAKLSAKDLIELIRK